MKPVIPVVVARQKKDGSIIPFKLMTLTRVPCVGEQVGYPSGTDGEEDASWRVTAVVHLPAEGGTGISGSIAEVWAVEETANIGFGPKK